MDEQDKQQLLVALMDIVGEMQLDTDLDWSMLGVNAFDSMHHIASGVVDLYANWQDMDRDQRELIMLATMVKLSLENFVLNVHRFSGR